MSAKQQDGASDEPRGNANSDATHQARGSRLIVKDVGHPGAYAIHNKTSFTGPPVPGDRGCPRFGGHVCRGHDPAGDLGRCLGHDRLDPRPDGPRAGDPDRGLSRSQLAAPRDRGAAHWRPRGLASLSTSLPRQAGKAVPTAAEQDNKTNKTNRTNKTGRLGRAGRPEDQAATEGPNRRSRLRCWRHSAPKTPRP